MHIHKIFRFDVLIDDLCFSFGSLKQKAFLVITQINMHSYLRMVLSIDQSDQMRDLTPHISLLRFKQITQLGDIHHLTCSILKFSQ